MYLEEKNPEFILTVYAANETDFIYIIIVLHCDQRVSFHFDCLLTIIPSHVGAKNKNKRKKCNIAHKEEQHWVRPNRKLILFESSQIDRENAFQMMRDSQANKNTERHKSNEYVKKKKKNILLN